MVEIETSRIHDSQITGYKSISDEDDQEQSELGLLTLIVCILEYMPVLCISSYSWLEDKYTYCTYLKIKLH